MVNRLLQITKQWVFSQSHFKSAVATSVLCANTSVYLDDKDRIVYPVIYGASCGFAATIFAPFFLTVGVLCTPAIVFKQIKNKLT